MRAAQITAMLHNVNVKKEDVKSIEDVRLKWEKLLEVDEEEPPKPLRPKQTVEKKIAIAHMWFNAFKHAKEQEVS